MECLNCNYKCYIEMLPCVEIGLRGLIKVSVFPTKEKIYRLNRGPKI